MQTVEQGARMHLLEPLVTENARDGSLVLTGTRLSVEALVRDLKADRSIDDVARSNTDVRRGHLVAIAETLRDAIPAFAVAADDLPGAVIVSRSERMGGAPTFVRSRVPVDILFDHLASGDTMAAFLDQYPDLTRDQACAVVDLAFAAASRLDRRNTPVAAE